MTDGWYERKGTGTCCCFVNGRPLCGKPARADRLVPVPPRDDRLAPDLKNCAVCDDKNDGLWLIDRGPAA